MCDTYALISPLLDEKDCSHINNLLKSCRHREDLSVGTYESQE